MKTCAIYTRVSTNMQAEKDYNSCEAQKDKILSYVKSQDTGRRPGGDVGPPTKNPRPLERRRGLGSLSHGR